MSNNSQNGRRLVIPLQTIYDLKGGVLSDGLDFEFFLSVLAYCAEDETCGGNIGSPVILQANQCKFRDHMSYHVQSGNAEKCLIRLIQSGILRTFKQEGSSDLIIEVLDWDKYMVINNNK